MLDAYLQVLELDFFEIGEAFGGLADENVWKRPAEGLLSVGELDVPHVTATPRHTILRRRVRAPASNGLALH